VEIPQHLKDRFIIAGSILSHASLTQVATSEYDGRLILPIGVYSFIASSIH